MNFSHIYPISAIALLVIITASVAPTAAQTQPTVVTADESWFDSSYSDRLVRPSSTDQTLAASLNKLNQPSTETVDWFNLNEPRFGMLSQPDAATDADIDANADIPPQFRYHFDPKDPDEWTMTVEFYGFLPAVDVDSTVSGQTVALDVDFKDVWDNFDVVALAGRFEARRNNWGFWVDGFWVNLTTDINGLPDPLKRADVDIAQGLGQFVAFRRFLLKYGKDDSDRWPVITLDAYGGARYQYLRQRIELKPGANLGTSKDWLEPLVGGRLALHFNDKIGIGLATDASGFGVGSASDLTFNVLLALEYRFNEKFYGRFGYNYAHYDYSSGSGADRFGLDGNLQGLWLGAAIVF